MQKRPLSYRFAEFTLAPARRVLERNGIEVPLIPRYFDLLVLLVERRHSAVTKQEIFDTVWSDVIVSDGALTQAVRSLRKGLSDSAREPRFIRTVSRHGYRFVYEDVVVEADTPGAKRPPVQRSPEVEERDSALAILGAAEPPTTEEEDQALLEAAETVLRSADDPDVARLRGLARALLRDARWELPEKTEVPLFGESGDPSAALALVKLRARRAAAVVRRRWLGAASGGATTGALAGLVGGLVLLFGPGSTATASVLVALPLVGFAVGGLGAFGVGGAIAWAEALVRSHRLGTLGVAGALGGGLIGAATHFVGLYTVEGLFGRDLSPVAGGFEGVVLGAAVGAGYALATPLREGGMATPRGRARLLAALLAGIAAGLASLALALTGHHLGAMSLDFTAQSFPGSQVSLDPLARLLGEAGPGTVTRGVLSGFEGLFFGSGLVLGLTRRSLPPPSRPS